MADVQHDDLDPTPGGRPQLRRVIDASTDPAAAGEEVPFETGLLRSLLIGGILGFVLVFLMVGGGFILAGIDPVASIMGALFVGAFAGVGFGAMTGASIHQP